MAHLALGIDIGGTKIAFGLVDLENATVLEKEKIPTNTLNPENFTEELIDRARPYIEKGASSIGIAIAGLVDKATGTLRNSPNLPKSLQNIPIKATFEASLNIPTAIDNDAHCFTLGEAHFGQGKGKNSLFGITLGTGIGGGYIIQGDLTETPQNSASEIGHITIDASSTIQCSCGKTGHLEALASGKAMTTAYAKHTGETLDAIEIEKRALGGDQLAIETIAAAGEALGIGIATIVQLLNPEIVVLGGGLVRMPSYTTKARETFAQHLGFNELANTPIVDTTLGDDAQLLGATLLTTRL